MYGLGTGTVKQLVRHFIFVLFKRHVCLQFHTFVYIYIYICVCVCFYTYIYYIKKFDTALNEKDTL